MNVIGAFPREGGGTKRAVRPLGYSMLQPAAVRACDRSSMRNTRASIAKTDRSETEPRENGPLDAANAEHARENLVSS